MLEGMVSSTVARLSLSIRPQAQRCHRACFQRFEGAALEDGQPEHLGLALDLKAVSVTHRRDVLHDWLCEDARPGVLTVTSPALHFGCIRLEEEQRSHVARINIFK